MRLRRLSFNRGPFGGRIEGRLPASRVTGRPLSCNTQVTLLANFLGRGDLYKCSDCSIAPKGDSASPSNLNEEVARSCECAPPRPLPETPYPIEETRFRLEMDMAGEHSNEEPVKRNGWKHRTSPAAVGILLSIPMTDSAKGHFLTRRRIMTMMGTVAGMAGLDKNGFFQQRTSR